MGNSTRNRDMINTLVDNLFRTEFRRLEKRELELVKENKLLSGGRQDGFFYRGILYSDLCKTIAYKGNKANVHPLLVPAMEKHVEDRKQVEFDRLLVKQTLALLFNSVRSLQDLRDALPNQLVEMIDPIKDLKRTRPEGYNLMAEPRKAKQYKKFREKIEFYTATRLLY